MSNIDESVLILGASSVEPSIYSALEKGINIGTILNVSSYVDYVASSPIQTKMFVEQTKEDENFNQLLIERAFDCIDKAEFIIVDLSNASTGMGVELCYLLTKYGDSKLISFIAKEGSKASPHILGLYKIATQKEPKVEYYTCELDVVSAVKRTSGYQDYVSSHDLI